MRSLMRQKTIFKPTSHSKFLRAPLQKNDYDGSRSMKMPGMSDYSLYSRANLSLVYRSRMSLSATVEIRKAASGGAKKKICRKIKKKRSKPWRRIRKNSMVHRKQNASSRRRVEDW